MVPGLMGYLGGLPTVSITSDIVDLVINDWIGTPPAGVRSDYILHVAAGVTVSASTVDRWAIKSRGRENSSIGYWKIDGYVLGAGGAGGTGSDYTPDQALRAGEGGGGGSGYVNGAGGSAFYAPRVGQPGTLTSLTGPWPGGAPGTPTSIGGGVTTAETPGIDGGRAAWISHDLIIDMSSGTGRIFGGGGGGQASGLFATLMPATAGGGPGEAGLDATLPLLTGVEGVNDSWPGAAGLAIDHSLGGYSVSIDAADLPNQVKGAYT